MNSYYEIVSKRAEYRCEYCRAPEVVFNFPFEVEHIIPVSLQGKTEESNLALACRSCNLRKGARISGTIKGSEQEVPFFNPRTQQWTKHFEIAAEPGQIVGVTTIGKITVEYLSMNSATQIAARRLWIRLDLFP